MTHIRCGGSSGLTPRWCGRRPEILERRKAPLSQQQIRERAATRLKTVGAILKKLVREGGRIERNAEAGYSVVAGPNAIPFRRRCPMPPKAARCPAPDLRA